MKNILNNSNYKKYIILLDVHMIKELKLELKKR